MIRPWHVCCNRVQHSREWKSGKKEGYRAYCNEIKRNKNRKRMSKLQKHRLGGEKDDKGVLVESNT